MIFVDTVDINPYLHRTPGSGIPTLDPDAPDWAREWWEAYLAAREKMSEGILTGKGSVKLE
ncbi:MAG: hypothetical protein IKG69_01500 [Atopobiaceae bacterium]|nr:hypothetical protein [Atopobiaceae bacterium]